MKWVFPLGRRAHPDYEVLSDHADGELAPAKAMEVNAHLAVCQECREDVDFMVELRSRLRELSFGRPRENLFAGITKSRAEGGSAITPLCDISEDFGEEGGRRESRLRIAMTAAVVVLSVVLPLALLGPGEVDAGNSLLRLDGHVPGEVFEVTYRTAGPLAERGAVRLRGAYYTFRDDDLTPGHPIETTLSRRGRGRFDGEIPIPPQTVYATFVVEDLDGKRVDRAATGDWEFLRRDASGRPTFEALMRKVLALATARPAIALETARELSRRFPDRPAAWSLAYLMADRAGQATDLLRDRHRERLAAFVGKLGPDPEPDDLAEIVEYASTLGEREVVERVGERLAERAPTHPKAVVYRLDRLIPRLGDPSRRAEALGALENEWALVGAATDLVPRLGLEFSVAAGNADGARTWAERMVAARPGSRADVALKLAGLPELRGLAIEWLDGALRDLERHPPRRTVWEAPAEHGRRVSRVRRDLLRTLGEFELAEGRGEGYGRLVEATANGWDPALFDEVAGIARARGDLETAIRLTALRAVDPLEGDASAARRQLSELGLDEASIGRRLVEARKQLRARLFAFDEEFHARGPVRVRSLGGETLDLLDRARGAPALVQFWDPSLPESSDRFRDEWEYCDRLAAGGVRFFAVSERVPGEALRQEIAAACPSVTLLVAPEEVAFSGFGTGVLRAGVALDPDGDVRLRAHEVRTLVRAVLTLRP